MSDHAEEKSSEESGSPDRVVPAGLLVGLFLVSLGLTWIMVVGSRLDLGDSIGPIPVDLATAQGALVVGIATVQGALVALFFMGLLWGKPFHRNIVLGTLIFAAAFVVLCVIDTRDYQVKLDPASPQVQEMLQEAQQSLTD